MATERYTASHDLVIEELDHIEGITEEELSTVSYVCTCTCSDDPAPTPTPIVKDPNLVAPVRD